MLTKQTNAWVVAKKTKIRGGCLDGERLEKRCSRQRSYGVEQFLVWFKMPDDDTV
jgi:hypothetical protein